MKRTFEFGKIDYNDTGRKINLVTVEVNLKLVEQKRKTIDLQDVENYYGFSVDGNIWDNIQSDIIAGGQMLDELNKYLHTNDTFKKIYTFWKKYHLNYLKDATRKQNEVLQNWKDRPEGWSYLEDCKYLETFDLLVDRGFKYGSDWLVEVIPDNDIEEIKKLIGEN